MTKEELATLRAEADRKWEIANKKNRLALIEYIKNEASDEDLDDIADCLIKFNDEYGVDCIRDEKIKGFDYNL